MTSVNFELIKHYNEEQSYEYQQRINEEIEHELISVKLRKYECTMEILPDIDYNKIALLLNYSNIKITNDTEFDNNDFIKDITTINNYTGKHIQVLINEYVKIAINRYLNAYRTILYNAISDNEKRNTLQNDLSKLVITFNSNCINILINSEQVNINFVPFSYIKKEIDCSSQTFCNRMSDYYEGKLIRERLIEPTKELQEAAKKYKLTFIENEDYIPQEEEDKYE